MLREITVELAARLAARGVPYQVVYGPERADQTVLVRSHIVVERDRDGGDQWLGPRSAQRNPRIREVRAVGGKCRVYARSEKPGASVWDHERIADKVVDQIVIGLREVVTTRSTEWRITASKLLSTRDLDAVGLTTWPGVVYEMAFQIDRGILDENYAGETNAEATWGGAHGVGASTTLDTDDSPEVTTDLPGAETRIG